MSAGSTRPTSMPAIAASARSSASARIVRPSGRAREKRPSETIARAAATIAITCAPREPDAAEDVDLVGVDVEGARLRSPGEEDRLAEDEREPDRREEEAHEARAAGREGTPEHDVEPDRERRGRDHREAASPTTIASPSVRVRR